MSALKPLVGQALVFWFCGGELLWRADGVPQPIDRRQAEILRNDFAADSRAAYREGNRDASGHAVHLWLELTEALDAYDTWRRVMAGGRAA